MTKNNIRKLTNKYRKIDKDGRIVEQFGHSKSTRFCDSCEFLRLMRDDKTGETIRFCAKTGREINRYPTDIAAWDMLRPTDCPFGMY